MGGMMKSFIVLALIYNAFHIPLVEAARADKKVFGRDAVDSDKNCNVSHALHILQDLSMTGESFCTSLLHTTKGATKTESIIVTTKEECSIKTESTTEHATFTTTIYGKTTTLPQLTFTSYSSTVLIPSGPSRAINKRNNPATPTSLSTCHAPTLSTACSSLLAPSTIRKTSTTTKTEHKCMSTTTITITTTHHTATSKIPFVVTPPPVSLTGTGILTTTVPAECVSVPYEAPKIPTPDGDEIDFSEYPYQPGTLVECCVACHFRLNCIAAAFDTDSDECELLTRVGSSSGVGVGGICPLGVQDFPFGPPVPEGNVLPGPCGM